MVEIEGIDAYYKDLQALWGVSMQVNEGELVALVGPNGAGKTTTLKVISGLLKPSSGTLLFEGRDLAKLSANSPISLTNFSPWIWAVELSMIPLSLAHPIICCSSLIFCFHLLFIY